ncbi:MAG: CotH kinase family protein, partial [Acetatifactor sp.]|nr:CotH kinase family protein [Acetatifactor sp.]
MKRLAACVIVLAVLFLGACAGTGEGEEGNSQMPVLEIHTEKEKGITSKVNYIKGTLTTKNVSENLALTDEPLQIRGRGNYSWDGTEKKSYRIKFDSKTNLLGQGKGEAKSWTLLAVHCDKTLLRTDAAYFFASKLETIPFVSSSSFVELYLNGKYQGVYEVCDQIQVNKARVNIDDTGEREEVGFLVEVDKNAKEQAIRISGGSTFEIKSDYSNRKQKKYIKDYLSSCYEAILSGDRQKVEELIDIPSAVDCYLVEEFMKNLDVGWGSFYFTKPKGDKLYFGPVWDFDLCAGNAENDNY